MIKHYALVLSGLISCYMSLESMHLAKILGALSPVIIPGAVYSFYSRTDNAQDKKNLNEYIEGVQEGLIAVPAIPLYYTDKVLLYQHTVQDVKNDFQSFAAQCSDPKTQARSLGIASGALLYASIPLVLYKHFSTKNKLLKQPGKLRGIALTKP